MSLKERLQTEMKDSLKSKDKLRLETVRSIINAVRNEEINRKLILDDPLIEKVITGLVKQRRDSIEQFKIAKRDDLVAKEESELSILMEFLPEQLSEAEIHNIVKSTISEIENVTIKDMGKVMKAVMSKLENKADGKVVSEIVKSFLK